MAFALSNLININRAGLKSLENKLLGLTITQVSAREKYTGPPPRLRNPTWFTQKDIAKHDDKVTPENREFLREVIQDRYKQQNLPKEELPAPVEWRPGLQRAGLLARKIGIYPLWLRNGKKISSTLLEVLDNHVIKYHPPESYDPPRKHVGKIYNRRGALLMGADAADPTTLTKEYCGIFKNSGVIPKNRLARFFVSPDAVLPPGTLLNAMHFPVGSYVDVMGLTIDRGFQGVMKRHGFKGMPASHGVTKTHRRGGNIGGGGEKGRVWPGTKMPGHMGNRWRTLRGLKVWRVNTKHNVLYVSGQNIPGNTNSIVYIYDTKVPSKKAVKPLPVPTYLEDTQDLPEDICDEELHKFGDPSIQFQAPAAKKD